jgi:hypothetical protein
MKVFDEAIVKGNETFFIAGRGGITNMHRGNVLVRQIVVQRATVYKSLGPGARGLKFAKKVLEEDLKGIQFVVGNSYFRRNYKNGKIAAAKLKSVSSEHGGLPFLEGLPSDAYLNIGETWTLNIIGAILRNVSVHVIVHSPVAPTRHNARRSCRQSTGKNNSIGYYLKPRQELEPDWLTPKQSHQKTAAPSPILSSQSISPRWLSSLASGANVPHDLMPNQPDGSSAHVASESAFEGSRRVSLDLCENEQDQTIPCGDLSGRWSRLGIILSDWEEPSDPVLSFDFSGSVAI